MVLESQEPRTKRYGNVTIAGVAQRRPDLDKQALWGALDDYAADLDDAVVGDDRYGVFYDIDESDGEFTYVAGVPVDSTDGLSPELTVVEIPDATWAVFQTTAGEVNEVVMDIERGEFGNVDHRDGVGVMFERYDRDENPSTMGSPLEFYVPIHED